MAIPWCGFTREYTASEKGSNKNKKSRHEAGFLPDEDTA
jgi:hypothetical protein